MDLGFSCSKFTWYNNHLGGARVWKRIERVFVIASWIQLYPNHYVQHLWRIASDNYPVLVMMETYFSYQSSF